MMKIPLMPVKMPLHQLELAMQRVQMEYMMGLLKEDLFTIWVA